MCDVGLYFLIKYSSLLFRNCQLSRKYFQLTPIFVKCERLYGVLRSTDRAELTRLLPSYRTVDFFQLAILQDKVYKQTKNRFSH